MARSLDDLEGISKRDSGNMLGAVSRFPDLLVDAAHFTPVDVAQPKASIENIVLVGMGGSASAADVLLDWLGDKTGIPVFVVREPTLPKFVNRKTLLIAISYSGETGETLAAFGKARERRCSLAAVTSGGRLQAICSRTGLPSLQLAAGLVPRSALSQMVGAGALILQGFGIVRGVRRSLLETGHELMSLRTMVRAEVPVSKNRAKQMALKLEDMLPVVYSLQRMSSVARRAKNQFAENSKVAAKFDLLPEAGHNEVEAWGAKSRTLVPLLVRDSEESSEERAVFAAFKAVLRNAVGVAPLEVRTEARSPLGRLLGPILFIDYVSVYLAFLRGVNPTPTQGIRHYRRLYTTVKG